MAAAMGAPLPLVACSIGWFFISGSFYHQSLVELMAILVALAFAIWGMGFLVAIMTALIFAVPAYALISRKYRVGLTTILSAGLIIGLIPFALFYPIFSKGAALWMAAFATGGLVGAFIFWWATERIPPQKEKGRPVARPPLPSSSVDEKLN